MKLLFDENLSVRLVALLADEYPSRVAELARFDASGEEALLVIEMGTIRSS